MYKENWRWFDKTMRKKTTKTAKEEAQNHTLPLTENRYEYNYPQYARPLRSPRGAQRASM